MRAVFTSTALALIMSAAPVHAEFAPWDLFKQPQHAAQDEAVTTGSISQPSKPQKHAFLFGGGGESNNISGSVIRTMLDGAEKGDTSAIEAAKQQFGANSAAHALVQWVYLRRAYPKDAQQMAGNFVKNNPDWPEATQIQRMANGETARSSTSSGSERGGVSSMLRGGKLREAANSLGQGDSWWSARHQVIRGLMDANDMQTAYQVARDHGTSVDTNQMDAEFLAGWIALRFQNDPHKADRHFAKLDEIAKRPISQSRASYWRGRAAEAMGNGGQAEWHYKNAAQYPTTYYGQLARAKFGADELSLPPSPQASGGDKAAISSSRIYQAILLLIKADKLEISNSFVKDFANKLGSAGHLAALGELLNEDGTAKHCVLVGKAAATRGIILTQISYPTDGVPNYNMTGPGVEKPVVYAIARQESEFDPKIRSSAGAVGLMQMLPSTAAQTARKFGIGWDGSRLTDPGYNASLGSTHLGELVANYNGSYIMTFAAYNAGPGRVREWVQKYGDPRTQVDAIDWVERIPFTETRNYVMRVMENTQIYRARLNGNRSTALLIESDMKRGGSGGGQKQKGWFE